jgi:tRNA (cytidine32/uridine32-2'-O)-methyltransferase
VSVPLEHLRVVLVRPQQPGNIGTVARAIANHGLGQLFLVDPPGFDPERARWMAPEAHHIIDQARFTATVAEAVADTSIVIGTSARRRRWDWPTLSPTTLGDFIADRPAAILFGPEDAGLSNADLALCQAIVSIPTTEHRSLNLGQAVTVIAAALRAGLPERPAPSKDDADIAMQNNAVQIILELLRGSDYLRGRPVEQVHGTLFRLLGRTRPSQREVIALLGMLHKMRRRMRLSGEE